MSRQGATQDPPCPNFYHICSTFLTFTFSSKDLFTLFPISLPSIYLFLSHTIENQPLANNPCFRNTKAACHMMNPILDTIQEYRNMNAHFEYKFLYWSQILTLNINSYIYWLQILTLSINSSWMPYPHPEHIVESSPKITAGEEDMLWL